MPIKSVNTTFNKALLHLSNSVDFSNQSNVNSFDFTAKKNEAIIKNNNERILKNSKKAFKR